MFRQPPDRQAAVSGLHKLVQNDATSRCELTRSIIQQGTYSILDY